MRCRFSSLRLAAGFAIVAVIYGCGRAAPTGPATVPASLKVTVDGEALAPELQLQLVPSPPIPEVSSVKATRGDDGVYVLETYAPADGAPPGDYLVEIVPVDTTNLTVTAPIIEETKITIPPAGGTVSVSLQSTGKSAPAALPPP